MKNRIFILLALALMPLSAMSQTLDRETDKSKPWNAADIRKNAAAMYQEIQGTSEESADANNQVQDPIQNLTEEAAPEPPVTDDKNAILDFITELPDFIFRKGCIDSDKMDLYLSGRLGLGLSSFTWEDGPVYGKCGFSLDAVAQFYLKEKISFLPAGYYAEASFGYAAKGASSFPMHYLDLSILPVGYSYDFKHFKAVGKFGFYTGFPVSKLKHTYDSNIDFGISLGAAVDYKLFSAGLTFNHGFINVSSSDVRLTNWSIMLQLTCKILSFNK